MTRERLNKFDPRFVRTTLNEAVDKADSLIENERQLIQMLLTIDQNKLFIRYGYKSLKGFCNFGLRFSRTQSQRIVTEVRRQQMLNPKKLTHYADGQHRDLKGIAKISEQITFFETV